MSAPAFPQAPPQMPQYAPSLTGALCRYLYLRSGWRVAGEPPDMPKLVAIAAPHSSNWDVIWGLLVKLGLRLDVRFIGKREAFFWPLGPVLRGFGGIPIDRRHAQNVVREMAELFAANERLWLAIAPEGTRKKVKEWKSGFWRIARAANVPILPVYFHYPEKTIGFGQLIYPSDDLDADMARIREFYRPWMGKNRGTV
ncbi:MAG: lysophospholipid acyltransferase family protein [Xanthomonadaceae bacterium]|nr:lysophospholipid acyltransferase family protein [Xanthomonadaceae bacterium]